MKRGKRNLVIENGRLEMNLLTAATA